MEPILASIPGYAEAVALEQSNRELAFIDLPIPLCGVTVNQMTPKHLLLLSGCENRFITGGYPREGDLETFLWIISTDYRTGQKEMVSWVRKRLKHLDKREAYKDISAYIERTFQDAPASNGVQQKQYTASVAFLVDLFGVEYGWTDTQVLNCPIARLYQLVKQIHMRRDPKAPRFNKSDAFISKMLQQRNAEAQAKAAEENK